MKFVAAKFRRGAGRTLAALALVLSLRGADPTPAAPSRWALPATDDGLPGAGPLRRFEGYRKLWEERRALWASRGSKDQGAIVFLGDSIIQYWGDSMGSLFPGIKTANRGIAADTTRGVLIRLRDDVLALHPRGVVLLIGTNDLDDHLAPEVIAGNLKLILEAMHRSDPAMPVLVCNLFPSSAAKNRPADQIKQINQLYFAAVQDEPQVTLLDTYGLFAGPQGDAKPEEFPDLLHPNAIGYAKWAAALYPVLETMGLVAAWPDDFTAEPGFESLCNGRDLTGWTYGAGSSFAGLTATPDARYVVKNGRLIVTISHIAHAYKKLWTTRQFPRDFVLKFEFRASPNSDSGLFVREPQLQIRDFWIAGPYVNLKSYRPLDWNEVVVTVKGGLAHGTCNGEVLIDAMPVPATGAIGLESDHGQVEYRRLRVRELP
jgi:lysophospholipase L1-like esterase